MMNTELIYKGLTRPAMFFGVPMVPLFITVISIFLFSVYTNFVFLTLLFPVIFLMREVVKKDEFIFRLLFLKLKFFNPNSKKQGRLKTMNLTSSYTKHAIPNLTGVPKISVLNLDKIPNFKQFLPYQTVIGGIVISKEYDFLATWEIDGINFEVENEVDIEVYKKKINMLLRLYSSESISFYFHNCRHGISDTMSSNFENEFLKDLDKRYYDSFKQSNLKLNKMFLTAVYSPVTKIQKSNLKRNSLDTRINELNLLISEFTKHCDGIENSLKDFGAVRLGCYEDTKARYSKQLEFYNYLISGKFSKVKVPLAPLYEYLNGSLNTIKFGINTAELEFNSGEKRYFKVIEIKDYPNESFTGIFDNLMYQDVDYTITQSFTPIKKVEAKEAIARQKKQMISAEDDALSQIHELDKALDDLICGNTIFGKYHFSVSIYGDSLKDVEDKTNKIIAKLADMGFLTTLASIALPASYFAQFPANFSIRPRLHTITSLNYSSFLAFHGFSKGKSDKNAWGKAVTMLKTPNKQPYYFNFHETIKNKDSFGDFLLGNTLVIGKSGGGKTVLMSFLLNQLAKFSSKDTFPKDIPEDKKRASFFYLDKDKGAIGNIIAGGGKYLMINGGVPTGFNPFMVDNTSENIRKIKILMKMLVTRNSEILSTLEEDALNSAVDSIMNNFSKDDRKYGISLMLEHLTEDISERNSLKSRLKLWSKENKFGWVFDNECDELKFDKESISIYGIDGTDLLNDNEISDVVSFYILWRIMDLADGRRFALIIDEAWDWIKNKTVAKEVHNKEKTIRKLNGFLVLGTQSVEDFAKSKIATAILEQSATTILLSNPNAKRADYVEKLNMSNEEYEFVVSTVPSEYKFLVKKAEEKAIVSIDLSSIGSKYLKILSTGSSYVDNIIDINNRYVDYKDKFEALKKLYK